MDSNFFDVAINSLLEEMRRYMYETNAGYTERDIQQCSAILDEFLRAIAVAKNRESGLRCIRKAVIRLNKLNNTCDGELIETDQREQICKLMIKAGALRGINQKDEDVTEQWREF